jgi:hypothetical protein
MSRVVTLVLVDGAGVPLGALPPFVVPVPWWPEVASVVTGARRRFGVEIAILRLLGAERPVPHGGLVSYLAESAGEPPAAAFPVDVDLPDDPRRPDYARPGGPAASLRWAGAVLDRRGLGPVTGTSQERTWNLSAIWRLATPSGAVWLKQVPHFFGHEAAVLRWAAGHGPVPRLLAADRGRMLLAEVPGEDLHDAAAPVRRAIAADLHRIQLPAVQAVAGLVHSGVPDRSGDRLIDFIAGALAGAGDLGPEVAELLAGLPARLDRVAGCGVPDTLVHGDLHPGNVRGDGRRLTIIDWGDSFIGHPGFDILHLAEGLPGPEASELTGQWSARWRADVPGCDPGRALELLRPVAALRNAAVYATFLAAVEPAEHPYHAPDIGLWLNRARNG